MRDNLNSGGSLAVGGQVRIRDACSGFASILAALILLLVAGWGMQRSICRAEEKPSAKPLFLVARPTILDPFFAQSVVLMIPLNLWFYRRNAAMT